MVELCACHCAHMLVMRHIKYNVNCMPYVDFCLCIGVFIQLINTVFIQLSIQNQQNYLLYSFHVNLMSKLCKIQFFSCLAPKNALFSTKRFKNKDLHRV